ncbi:hypothetical protein SDC9_101647 [bioreactor metagenome]|uniref:Uncharacterized protein n=1 Tax=bioreactor metagenome TaxID=1076179 RepID=A0A645AZC2_9ZZZZ
MAQQRLSAVEKEPADEAEPQRLDRRDEPRYRRWDYDLRGGDQPVGHGEWQQRGAEGELPAARRRQVACLKEPHAEQYRPRREKADAARQQRRDGLDRKAYREVCRSPDDVDDQIGKDNEPLRVCSALRPRFPPHYLTTVAVLASVALTRSKGDILKSSPLCPAFTVMKSNLSADSSMIT